jgi:NADPH:quinone reductase-like Zn-dependent oxidoreductase
LGVRRAFNYQTEDLEAAARTALRGFGFELILDPLGPESFQRSMRMLSPLGRLVCYGFSQLVTGPKRKLWHAATQLLKATKFNPITLMNENKGVFGLNLAQLFTQKDLHATAMARMGELLAEGALRPTIHRTFPLTAQGAADAHTFLHERQNFGKVVLARDGAQGA